MSSIAQPGCPGPFSIDVQYVVAKALFAAATVCHSGIRVEDVLCNWIGGIALCFGCGTMPVTNNRVLMVLCSLFQSWVLF